MAFSAVSATVFFTTKRALLLNRFPIRLLISKHPWGGKMGSESYNPLKQATEIVLCGSWFWLRFRFRFVGLECMPRRSKLITASEIFRSSERDPQDDGARWSKTWAGAEECLWFCRRVFTMCWLMTRQNVVIFFNHRLRLRIIWHCKHTFAEVSRAILVFNRPIWFYFLICITGMSDLSEYMGHVIVSFSLLWI